MDAFCKLPTTASTLNAGGDIVQEYQINGRMSILQKHGVEEKENRRAEPMWWLGHAGCALG
jgi:hypothetical protein